MDAGVRGAIEGLLTDYVTLIDEDRLEEWLDVFAEECVYRIIARENVRQGLPLPLMLCDNKNMLRDRIVSLREANIYNIHTDRHLVSAIRIADEDGGVYSIKANYAVFQTSQEGETRIFSAGTYADKVVFEGDTPKFKEKVVIVDTASVPTLLSTPI